MAKTLADVIAAGKSKSKTNYQRTVKPKSGRSVWRILPGWNKDEPAEFFHAFGQHFIKDMDGKVKVVVGCPEKTFDHECEICDAIQEAARATDDDKVREKILESRSSQRFLFNAIDVDADPNKVVILEVGSGLFNDIIANIEEDPDLIDPDKGRDLVINRDGTGLNTRYSLAVRSKEKSISVSKSCMMELNDLAEYVKDDFEKKKTKALNAIGLHAGAAISGSKGAKALAGPEDIDLDDEIPEFGKEEVRAEAEKEVEDAEVEYDAAPDESDEAEKGEDPSFGDDISDDDIESMLADLG